MSRSPGRLQHWVLLIFASQIFHIPNAHSQFVDVDQIQITSYQLESVRRISRFGFEYEYSVTLDNAGDSLDDVTGSVVSQNSRVSVTGGEFSLGVFEAGTERVVSLSIRHSRQVRFTESDLSWSFSAAAPVVTVGSTSVNASILSGTAELQPINVSVDFPGGFSRSQLGIAVSEDLAPFTTAEFVSVGDAQSVQLELVYSAPLDAAEAAVRGEVSFVFLGEPLPGAVAVSLDVIPPTANEIPDNVSTPITERIVFDEELQVRIVQSEALVQLAADATEQQLSTLVESFGGVFAGSIRAMRTYQVVFPDIGSTAELALLIDQLNQASEVEVAVQSLVGGPLELDINLDPEYLAVDPSDIWDESAPTGATAPFEFVRFPSAWQSGVSNTDILVAIVDDSFDVQHDDLAINITGIDGTETNRFRHGTNVAGVLAANQENGIGVAGSISRTNLLLYGIGDPQAGEAWSTGRLLGAMVDAVEDGANIVNISGAVNTFDGQTCSALAATFDVLTRFRRLFSGLTFVDGFDETLFVVAAGNVDSAAACVPANFSQEYDNILSVTNLSSSSEDPADPGFFVPTRTVAGATVSVDVAAPGRFYTTTPVNSYRATNGGSSFAAPMVSGLAALMLAANEELTADQIKRRVLQAAAERGGPAQLPDGTTASFNILNAARAIELATGDNSRPTELPFTESFDRPDSIVVGNGWLNSPNNVGRDLQILNSQLAVNWDGESDGDIGIYRPIQSTLPITISATIFPGSGFAAIPLRYNATLGIQSNGSTQSGYKVQFFRSDSNINNSYVALIDGDTEVQRIGIANQFGPSIDVTIQFAANGQVTGSVMQQGISEEFSFNSHSPASDGVNLIVTLADPDERAAVPDIPRIDNLVVESPVLNTIRAEISGTVTEVVAAGSCCGGASAPGGISVGDTVTGVYFIDPTVPNGNPFDDGFDFYPGAVSGFQLTVGGAEFRSDNQSEALLSVTSNLNSGDSYDISGGDWVDSIDDFELLSVILSLSNAPFGSVFTSTEIPTIAPSADLFPEPILFLNFDQSASGISGFISFVTVRIDQHVYR